MILSPLESTSISGRWTTSDEVGSKENDFSILDATMLGVVLPSVHLAETVRPLLDRDIKPPSNAPQLLGPSNCEMRGSLPVSMLSTGLGCIRPTKANSGVSAKDLTDHARTRSP